jgi:type III pantothenate kinase
VTPDVVVDVGNSRIKWGWKPSGDGPMEMASLPPDDEAAWGAQAKKLPFWTPISWAVASVHPARLERFTTWATRVPSRLRVIEHSQIPLTVNVDEPDKVGIDRLLGAVAAKAMTTTGMPAITVDVGTAVTVNLIDAHGVFQGGAIFPGPRLMGRVLHEHTAKLPLIDLTGHPYEDTFPPKNTAAAIRFGIDSAVLGGVNTLLSLLADKECRVPPLLLLTGGACHLLDGCIFPSVAEQRFVPTLTLEGIRIAAEALP